MPLSYHTDLLIQNLNSGPLGLVGLFATMTATGPGLGTGGHLEALTCYQALK